MLKEDVPPSKACGMDVLDRDGFIILESVLGPDQVAELIQLTGTCSPAQGEGVLHREGEVYGVRDLAWRLDEIRGLARSPELIRLVEPILGPGAFLVRGLYFDKTPTANWNLPWHQDLTIAVRSRRDVPGFGPWTLKAGIHHVQAPAALLSRMATVRLHLDDCGLGNGPMRVLPGSHREGKLTPEKIAAWTSKAPQLAVDCLVRAGGAVVMSPLILHASAAASENAHRRVIHLEYASEQLLDGLEWYRRDMETDEPITFSPRIDAGACRR